MNYGGQFAMHLSPTKLPCLFIPAYPDVVGRSSMRDELQVYLSQPEISPHRVMSILNPLLDEEHLAVMILKYQLFDKCGGKRFLVYLQCYTFVVEFNNILNCKQVRKLMDVGRRSANKHMYMYCNLIILGLSRIQNFDILEEAFRVLIIL